MHILRYLVFALSLACSFAYGGEGNLSDGNSSLFSDTPYELNLNALQALDPKPLKISTFSPDPNPKSHGIRIASTGLVFPTVYQVVSIKDIPGPEVLNSIANSLKSRSEVILLERLNNAELGDHLHYFQRVSVNGKPQHVSSNYIFIKGKNFFHLAAMNYAASVMGRESWGEVKPDTNAEGSVQFLLKAMQVK